MEQPQLFTIPASVLTNLVTYLSGQPFGEVASLMFQIDNTVKLVENNDGTGSRQVRKRQGRKPE